MLNHVTYLYGFNLSFAEMLVKDLSTEQMAAQPGGVINHPAWSLGHLVVSADRLGQLLGLPSNLPDGWSETFKTGGEPSGDSSAFPRKEEILGALKEQHTRNSRGSEEHRCLTVRRAAPGRREAEVLPDGRGPDRLHDDVARDGPPGADRRVASCDGSRSADKSLSRCPKSDRG